MPDFGSPPPVASGIKFEMLEESLQISGSANRGEAAVTVKPSGNTSGNTEMKVATNKHLEAAGLNGEKFRFAIGVNKELGVIALYVTNWEKKGAVPVRVYPNSLVFHLGAIFRKYPSLRPNTTVETELTPTTDAEGRACLAFNILSALPKPKTRKKKSDNQESTTADK